MARASREAIKAIEKAGGNITCRYFNRLALRATLKPEKFWRIPKFADPVKARDKGNKTILFVFITINQLII